MISESKGMFRDRVLPDGRTYTQAMEDIVSERRDDPITSWVGADAQIVAHCLGACSRSPFGSKVYGAVVAEALWRHYEELNP